MNTNIESAISGLMRNAQENIKAAYLKGYSVARKEITAEAQESEYRHGVNDAEKASKRLWLMPEDGGLYPEEMSMIFGCGIVADILNKNSMLEIIEKIREYDEKKQQECLNKVCVDEIHVGDEVYILDSNRLSIVTRLIDEGRTAIIMTEIGAFTTIATSQLHKTGRMYMIGETLEELRGDNEN